MLTGEFFMMPEYGLSGVIVDFIDEEGEPNYVRLRYKPTHKPFEKKKTQVFPHLIHQQDIHHIDITKKVSGSESRICIIDVGGEESLIKKHFDRKKSSIVESLRDEVDNLKKERANLLSSLDVASSGASKVIQKSRQIDRTTRSRSSFDDNEISPSFPRSARFNTNESEY